LGRRRRFLSSRCRGSSLPLGLLLGSSLRGSLLGRLLLRRLLLRRLLLRRLLLRRLLLRRFLLRRFLLRRFLLRRFLLCRLLLRRFLLRRFLLRRLLRSRLLGSLLLCRRLLGSLLLCRRLLGSILRGHDVLSGRIGTGRGSSSGSSSFFWSSHRGAPLSGGNGSTFPFRGRCLRSFTFRLIIHRYRLDRSCRLFELLVTSREPLTFR